MKRWILVFLCLMMATTAFGGDLRITIRADWMFTLRAGIEYRFGRYFGIQTDIGTNTQLLAADVCGVFYAMEAERRSCFSFRPAPEIPVSAFEMIVPPIRPANGSNGRSTQVG